MAPVQIERAMWASIPHAPGMSSRAQGELPVLGGGGGAGGLRHVLVPALAELLDRLRAEGGDVVGLAARDETLVDVELLVDPGAPRVAAFGRKRRPRRDRPALHDARLDEDPRPVADRRDRLLGLREGGREVHGVLVGAQKVAVRDAAGNQQAVVVVRAGVRDLLVDRQLVAVVEVVEGLDLAGVEAEELGARAGLLERLARLGQLDLLDAVGGEDRDLLAVQLAHVGSFPFGCSGLGYRRAGGAKRARLARVRPVPAGARAGRSAGLQNRTDPRRSGWRQ